MYRWYILWSTLKFDLLGRPKIDLASNRFNENFDQNSLYYFDFLTSERIVYLLGWLTLCIFSSYPHVFVVILRYCSHPKCYSVHGYKIKIICNHIEIICFSKYSLRKSFQHTWTSQHIRMVPWYVIPSTYAWIYSSIYAWFPNEVTP